MAITDPISDMLTRINNAQHASHETVDIPASRLLENILQIFNREGYIKSFEVIPNANQNNLRVHLKYLNGKKPIISGMKRISKPSRRMYVKKDRIPVVNNGLGMAIITTSKGILTGKEAKKENLGGELLCTIW
jgi:small subunit ribosomal protein S8